jgi:hypothetical protein
MRYGQTAHNRDVYVSLPLAVQATVLLWSLLRSIPTQNLRHVLVRRNTAVCFMGGLTKHRQHTERYATFTTKLVYKPQIPLAV